jgi:hypothetical protein
VTQWSGTGFEGDPVDPNPASPTSPPVYYGPAPTGFGYPPPAYPAPPPWTGYGQPAPARPAAVTASSVLGCILGSLILLEGFLLLVGASVVQGIEDSLDQSSGLPPSLVVNGLLNLAVGGALIAGSVLLANRRANGRLSLAVANVVVVGQAIYWTVASPVDALPISVLHAAVAAIGLALAFTAAAGNWLRAETPDR